MSPITKLCKYSQKPLGYMQASYDAEQRMKRGEKQAKCPECGLYHWLTNNFQKRLNETA